jgi:hypothetical protein
MKKGSLLRVALMSGTIALAGTTTIALGLISTSTAAVADMCPASLSGSCSTTDPGDAALPYPTFVDIDGEDNSPLTFLAVLNPSNQNPSTVSAIVTTFLNANSFPSVTYLGRAGTSGSGPDSSSVSTTSTDGFSGTWTFSPGTTSFLGQFIALHAGGGQSNVLYQINTPGLSGIWDTSENITGNNQQGALSNFDLFNGGAQAVPGPIVGAGWPGLIAACGGLLALARRRRLQRIA